MKTITNLVSNNAPAESDWQETRGHVSTILDNPQLGFYRHVFLGQAGIVVERFDGQTFHRVGIPLSEILALAERAEPALAPPVPSPTPQNSDTPSRS